MQQYFRCCLIRISRSIFLLLFMFYFVSGFFGVNVCGLVGIGASKYFFKKRFSNIRIVIFSLCSYCYLCFELDITFWIRSAIISVKYLPEWTVELLVIFVLSTSWWFGSIVIVNECFRNFQLSMKSFIDLYFLLLWNYCNNMCTNVAIVGSRGREDSFPKP